MTSPKSGTRDSTTRLALIRATAQIMIEEGYAGAESNLQRQRRALGETEPLHALWQLNSAQGAQLWMEFMALANHRKAIRSEIAAYAERFRDLEEAALMLVLRSHGVDVQAFPPVVMSMIVASVARNLVLERGLGITRGHAEALAFIDRYLDRFEMRPWQGDGSPDDGRQ